jgi:hypothetical protein
MKKFILGGSFLLILGLAIAPLHAQVGINTESGEPVKGIAFQVKSSPASTDNGVVVKSDGNGGATLSIGAGGNLSASVVLNATDKAFLPNKVQLKTPVGEDPANPNPIRHPVSGMIIFNSNDAGESPDNVVQGLYVYDAQAPNENTLSFPRGRWIRCSMQGDVSDVRSFRLSDTNDVLNDPALPLSIPVPAMSNANYNAADFKMLGGCYSKPIWFVPTDPVTAAATPTEAAVIPAVSALTVATPGSYAVAIGLYGSISSNGSSGITNGKMWIAVVRTTTDADTNAIKYNIEDVAEIYPVAYGGTAGKHMSYPITLGFKAKTGDKISIVVAKASTCSLVWNLTRETTITFWKV